MQFADAGDEALLPPEEPLLPSDLIEEVASFTSGPETSSPAPSTEGTTPNETRPGGDEEVALPEFDPRCRDEFEGLLYIGALAHEFTWAGHRFKIRTITSGEVLEVGLEQKQYRDSLGESRAYVTAMAAACLVSVDGKPLPRPISNDPSDTEFANKYSYIRESWYTWTVDAVYEEYMKLEARVVEIIEAMGKARPSARSTRG